MAVVQRIVVVSVDPTIARLLKLNLERRGFGVEPHPWAACCGIGEAPPICPSDLLIADLHCAAPACWNAGPSLRTLFPRVPLLLLAPERPSARYLQAHDPCDCLQKPFGIADALSAIDALIRSERLDNWTT